MCSDVASLLGIEIAYLWSAKLTWSIAHVTGKKAVPRSMLVVEASTNHLIDLTIPIG